MERGFSLVELLVVVIVIAVIAALAIPSLLASRRAANEASAIATVRNIHSAEVTYFSVYGGNQNYGSLSALGANDLLDDLVGGADTTSKSGYTFTVSLPPATPFLSYCATGLADAFGQSGSRDFAISTESVVYASSTQGSMSCADGALDSTGGVAIQ